MNELLFYAGGALPILWGISHLFPSDRSSDNPRTHVPWSTYGCAAG